MNKLIKQEETFKKSSLWHSFTNDTKIIHSRIFAKFSSKSASAENICRSSIFTVTITKGQMTIVKPAETRAITERDHTPHQRIVIEQVLVTE